jgi:hypothetical protein
VTTVKSLLILSLLFASSLSAQESLSGYEPVLLPVYAGFAPVNGVNGSTFGTRLRVFTERPFTFFPGVTEPFETVGVGFLPRDFAVPSKGRVVWIERAAVNDVHFGYTLSSSDANFLAPGLTSLPVVRERELRGGRIELLNVPAWRGSGDRFRHTLRIYDVLRNGSAVVTVRIELMDVGGAGTLETFTVPVDRFDGADASYPYYAELPLELPCLRFGSEECGGYSARLSLTVAPDIPFWAFVSSTDNVTQQVSIYAPQ